jgi:hypothetical protein
VTIGDLLPFTFYEFTVVAFTIETGPGASDIVRTGEAAPTAPTNVIATEVNSTHVTSGMNQTHPMALSDNTSSATTCQNQMTSLLLAVQEQ